MKAGRAATVKRAKIARSHKVRIIWLDDSRGRRNYDYAPPDVAQRGQIDHMLID